jgi:hypothetical protein
MLLFIISPISLSVNKPEEKGFTQPPSRRSGALARHEGGSRKNAKAMACFIAWVGFA